MRIILRQDIETLGNIGDIVNVKPGYARNYLIPNQMAYFATEGAINKIEQEKKQYLVKMAEVKSTAEKLAEKFDELQVTIAMKVGEEGKLYGSVTTQMISSELALQGYEIDKRDITIVDPIKTLGVFQVKVKLHPEVAANLRVWVISEE
jgi:large subunit ribosomal protein L9